MRRKSFFLFIALLFIFITGIIEAGDRVFKLEELTYPEIDKLDREKSIVFLTFGNLEEHGPHLPVGSDYFEAIGMRDKIIGELQKIHPDYNFILFPIVPVGEGGAGGAGRQFDHIGDYMIRFETLRNLAIDLGGTIARKGFKNIVVIHYHGGPLHGVALNEASAFVSETYHARMINLTGLILGNGVFNKRAGEIMNKYLGDGWIEIYGLQGHACAGETSTNLYLRGDLVKPGYKDLPPFIVKNGEEFWSVYKRKDWQGYWGAPSKASKGMGEEIAAVFTQQGILYIEKIMAGENLSKLAEPTSEGEGMPEAMEDWLGKLKAIYAQQTEQIEQWLKKKGR